MSKTSKLWLLIVSVLAAVATLTTPAAGQETARYDGPIIDMHMHAYTVRKDAEDLFTSPCKRAPALTKTEEDVRRLTLEVMDRHNIVLGFLSQCPLDTVYHWVEAAPDRFIASPQIWDPGLIDLDGLRKEYEAGRLGGLGELGAQYVGMAADDPKLEPFFALAEEFDVPVLIHSHGTGAPAERFRIAIGRPTRIEEVLVRHPTLRIYIEGSGFPFLEETIALMYHYPNVYGDLSASRYPRKIFHWYLHRLMDAGLGKRLMFGSDRSKFPKLIGEAIEAIESAPFLTEEEKRDIFYNNAARFLRLSKETIAKHHGQ
ncbi:MAG: amidohydrolase family protein [Acidobacteria bacterium]|nr:amidohydrolase family protein [Acidobacteriota bacterium]